MIWSYYKSISAEDCHKRREQIVVCAHRALESLTADLSLARRLFTINYMGASCPQEPLPIRYDYAPPLAGEGGQYPPLQHFGNCVPNHPIEDFEGDSLDVSMEREANTFFVRKISAAFLGLDALTASRYGYRNNKKRFDQALDALKVQLEALKRDAKPDIKSAMDNVLVEFDAARYIVQADHFLNREAAKKQRVQGV